MFLIFHNDTIWNGLDSETKYDISVYQPYV